MEARVKRIIREELDRVLREQTAPQKFAIQNGRLVVNGKPAQLDVDAMGKLFKDVKVQKTATLPDGGVTLTLQAGSLTRDVTVKKTTVDGILKSFAPNPAQPYKESFFGGAFTISPIAASATA